MVILRTQMVDALIALVFGLGLVVAPALILSILGAHTDDAGIVVARLLGATLLGYAGIDWSTMRAADSGLRTNIIRTEAAVDVLAFVVSVAATIAGTVNILGWSLVVTFAALAAARLYGTAATPRVAA
jgi:hypothetical protein